MNKFEIVSGQKNENELNNQKYAGVSYYKEDEDFFRLQLNIFPNILKGEISGRILVDLNK